MAGLRRLELDALDQTPCQGLHIVMEATGKWHRAVQRSQHADGFYVSVVDPLRARLADGPHRQPSRSALRCAASSISATERIGPSGLMSNLVGPPGPPYVP